MFFFAHAFPSSVPNCVRKMSFGCGFRDICLCVYTAYSLYRHTDSLLRFSFLFIIVDLHTKFLSLLLFLTILISIREQMMITNFISLVHWWRSLTRLFFASWIYTIYTGQTGGQADILHSFYFTIWCCKRPISNRMIHKIIVLLTFGRLFCCFRGTFDFFSLYSFVFISLSFSTAHWRAILIIL